jgi:hypothetical protein
MAAWSTIIRSGLTAALRAAFSFKRQARSMSNDHASRKFAGVPGQYAGLNPEVPRAPHHRQDRGAALFHTHIFQLTFRPMFGGVEGDNADRAVKLTCHQIGKSWFPDRPAPDRFNDRSGLIGRNHQGSI